ncbi:MAG: type II and III secretion system protein family protein [Acidobacteria bacterium]|nr:type II and III secretion system protein family protein [Acidobacteriota bacterium]MBI3657965.1 type II and III secretion system protein family protein [Acidobacteriota bacterium]
MDSNRDWKTRAWRLLGVIFSAGLILPLFIVVTGAVPADSTPTLLKVEASAAPNEIETLSLTVGRSLLIDMADPAERVSVTNAEVAEAVPISPQQLMINGKGPGRTTLVIWDKTGRRMLYELLVQIDTNALTTRLKDAFPTEQIAVAAAKDSLVLSGMVSTEYVMTKAVELANLYVKNVANLLRIPPSAVKDEPQILLQVKFAEVDRTVSEELGANLTRMADGHLVGTVGTGQFGSTPRIHDIESKTITGVGRQPYETRTTFSFSDLVGLFIWKPDINLAATIHALQTKGLLQILAEPNLVTRNGKEASFLAGGEFPFTVVQGTGGSTVPVITVQFKEFGIKLNFTPTLQPNGVIRLKVKPEVSDLDFTNAVTLSNVRIPAIKTRRAETEVDLRDGQSFAIAGLIDNRVLEDYRKVPILASIPVIGNFFKSRELRKSNSELVVLVTPKVVKPLDSSEVPPIPEIDKPFLREKNFEGKFGHQEQKKQ